MTSTHTGALLAGQEDENRVKAVAHVDMGSPDVEEPKRDLAPLLAALESPNLSVFECLDLLVKHSDNIGVHFRLCQQLRTFPQRDIEFFLPQLVHIFVSYETESAALEDFLDDLCHDSTHCTLIIFWHLQASLSDLEDQPQSYGFAAAKRLYNKIQNMIFAGPVAVDEQIRDNTQPALVLASMVAASTAVPEVGRHIRPLVVSQGRKQRSLLLRVASRLKRLATPTGDTARDAVDDTADIAARHAAHAASVDALSLYHTSQPDHRYAAAASMPDLSRTMTSGGSVAYNLAARRMSGDIIRSPLRDQLKTNYFRCETQFVYSLQSISTRLLRVPPAARLSALQLELALINRDLPAEVDIPLLIPDSAGHRHNRIVRISPTEATVLNSAEKVPYLLLVEYLKGDLTFNPESERNRHLLQKNGQRKYLFDRNFSQPPPDPNTPLIETTFDEEEQDLGLIPVADREQIVAASESQVSLVPDPLANGGLGAPLTREEAEAATANESENGHPSTPAAATVSINDLASQMDMASIILSQLEGAQSTKLAKAEVEAIKSRIVANMQAMQNHDVLSATTQGAAGARKLENDLKTAGLSTSDDPSAANLAEDWTARKNRLRKSSPYGHYPSWDLFSVIVKVGDDLRQEALACQMISRARQIWREAKVDVWVKEMRILITSSNSGLVETITNGLSIHSIKKALTGVQDPTAASGVPAKVATLSQHFVAKFGSPKSLRYQQALKNFVRSLAPYSLLCYILQIKDRHNGNILLDNEGHIIHIDFGFMLSNSPGGRFALEVAPFKLTHEYVDLMGGTSSPMFKQFVELLKKSFHALRKHADEFTAMIEIMSNDSTLACFQNGPATASQLRQRFHTDLNDSELDNFVENSLVYKSYGSVYTRGYDQFQMLTQGIYS